MTSDGESPFIRRNGKSEAAFRTISEVADDLDVPQHVLRFWESKFPQVKPLKRGGGRRYYRPEDVALLRRIRDLLYSEGYTIKGVQKLLREGAGGREAAPVRQNALDLPLPVDDTEVDGAEADEAEVDEAEVDEAEVDEVGAGQSDAEGDEDIAEGHEDGADVPEDEAEDDDDHPSALAPEVRRELEDLLDELEQLRRLLQPRS